MPAEITHWMFVIVILTQAEEMLGFRPTPTEKAIEDTIKFYADAFIKVIQGFKCAKIMLLQFF